jgi:hypothetical protein
MASRPVKRAHDLRLPVSPRRSERGAVLVQTAIAMIGLLAFSAFVIDYGILWSARRQAQNAADAGAMAGAISLGFVDATDYPLARTSAVNTARENFVWGEAPDVLDSDVTVPYACPPGSPGFGTDACIKVDVFRTAYQRANGSPLPTLFANLVGVSQQGVRATATAQVLYGYEMDCVKPFAIPDKWAEVQNDQGPVGWDPSDTFDRYVQRGSDAGQLLDPPDYYEPPVGNNPGTGYTNESVTLGGGDYGRQIILKFANPGQGSNDPIAPGFYNPVQLTPGETGAPPYENNIRNCNSTMIRPGDFLTVEPGAMIGPTAQGMRDLIALDRDAVWDPTANEGRGGISGGCMTSTTNACAVSPRLVAIPVYNPQVYADGRASGRGIQIQVVKILGFFMEAMNGNEITGRLMTIPGPPRWSGTAPAAGTAFVISIALVR